MNYLLTTGLDLKTKKFTVTQFNLISKIENSITLNTEAHDLIQNPHQKNICVALGRRPPIHFSYILDLSTNQIINRFAAIPEHAFYGHGVWLENNVIATAEIHLQTKQSCIVFRDGSHPDKILDVIATSGLMIHSMLYDKQHDSFFIAHNGLWESFNKTHQSNLSILSLRNKQVEIINFPTPNNIGLQHLHRIDNWLYCLFRLGPENPPGKCWNFSPLFKVNLITNEVKEVSLGSTQETIEFGYDGLSINSTNDLIGMTSQRSHQVYFINVNSNDLIQKKVYALASGITPFNDSFIISSASGKLIEYDPYNDKAIVLSENFYASSHHQHIRY